VLGDTVAVALVGVPATGEAVGAALPPGSCACAMPPVAASRPALA
jgi:hypothetical protein